MIDVGKLRLRIAMGLTYVAVRIAPKEVRSILRIQVSLLQDLPEEFKKHEGGVIYAGWSRTARGAKLASRQCAAVELAVAEIRAQWEAEQAQLAKIEGRDF